MSTVAQWWYVCLYLNWLFSDLEVGIHVCKDDEHNWMICVDFKMVNILFGKQGGFTKYLYFLSLWRACCGKEFVCESFERLPGQK